MWGVLVEVNSDAHRPMWRVRVVADEDAGDGDHVSIVETLDE